MKILAVLALFIFSTTSVLSFQNVFPLGPDAKITTGSLCDKSSEFRYPEKISYCKRDVSSNRKQAIFVNYRSLGFTLPENNRGSYKIDHYIPLCAGGSNLDSNLWPQHKSVYEITDPLEPLACEKLAEGLIKQSDLVILIKKAKNDLSQVQAVMDELNRL